MNDTKPLPFIQLSLPSQKTRERCWYLKQRVLTAGYHQAELEDPDISEEALYEKNRSQKCHKDSQDDS